MYQLLVRLMLIAALAELGMSSRDLDGCAGRECVIRLERASRQVLRIDWKPISVWPVEAGNWR